MSDVPRCAIVVRVSSASPFQLSEMRDAIAAQRWRIAHIYRDNPERRPIWDEFLEAVRTNQFERVVVWSLDQLGRTPSEILRTLKLIFDRAITIYLVRDSILAQPHSLTARSLVLTMGAVIDVQQTAMTERVRRSMKAAKDVGRLGGRPRANVPREDLEAIRDERDTVANVASRHDVSPATVKRRLREMK